jgi:hypothetical protein
MILSHSLSVHALIVVVGLGADRNGLSHKQDVGKKKSKGKGTPAAPQMIALGSRTGRVVLFSLVCAG